MFEVFTLRGLASKLPAITMTMFIALAIVLMIGVAKLQTWWYEKENKRLKAEVLASNSSAIAAKKDEAQVIRSADITAKADANIDQRMYRIHTETDKAVEAVNESIRKNPVPDFVVPDSELVRNASAAHSRAQAASDRLQSANAH